MLAHRALADALPRRRRGLVLGGAIAGREGVREWGGGEPREDVVLSREALLPAVHGELEEGEDVDHGG